MKIFNILFISILFYALTAFVNPGENLADLTGTYSVCTMENYPVSLTLNQDKSFTYRDLTNPNNLIEISGEWTLDKKKVILLDAKGSTDFHYKWKLNNNNGLSARKGMSFYSLHKLDNCK